jgi:catalase
MHEPEVNWAQVFFIRDGFKFPDLVHALRPNPANNIQEAWRFLDFLSYHPESAHIVSRLPQIPCQLSMCPSRGAQ